MRIKLPELKAHLKQSLKSAYFISGEEFELISEAISEIIACAKNQGFTATMRTQADSSFDSTHYFATFHQISLFSQQELWLLDFSRNKPTSEFGNTLGKLLEKWPTQKILVVNFGKLETQQMQTKWFKQIENSGVHIIIPPLRGPWLQTWLRQKLEQKGLFASPVILELIADAHQNNTLALTNLVEKLSLIYAEKTQLTEENILPLIFDQSQFSVFDITEAIISGDQSKALRILKNLRASQDSSILVLWVITRTLRTLLQLSEVSGKVAQEKILQASRIWPREHAGYIRASQRFPAKEWQHKMITAQEIDEILKQSAASWGWQCLTKWATEICSP